MMAADVRTYDGTLNNLANPEWGSTGEALVRTVAAEYADGLAAPAGANRPSAREISNALATQDGEFLNDRELSAFVYAWGQFIDHDLDLTTNGVRRESFPIAVPTGDPHFDPFGTGTATIGLNRSNYDPQTGDNDPRQQINDVTAYLDGSMIYGSDATRAAALRTLQGGRLKTSDGNNLPYNYLNLPNDNQLQVPYDTLYAAGDVRANENIELTAIHTLFMREHNRLADQYSAAHLSWTDEQIFQAARRTVIAELQAITYNEFLPALLGDGAVSRYRGYDPSINPGVANEFSTAAFRLGHSMLGADVEFLDNLGQEVHEEVELRDAFFNPELMAETGIDPILKYLASDPAREIDNKVVDDVRNFLFGPPGAGGFDLASLNIQRGRDHGLADYNATRVAYGLRPVTDFDQISSDPAVQAALEEMYGNVDNIDLWVGGLAEDHARGSSLGPLFREMVADQFERIRDGDRFWYQRDLSRSELNRVNDTSLADVIRMNTTIGNLQADVFTFHTSISGSVQIDVNRDGRISSRDVGLPGVTVELVDLDGNVIATAITRRNGRYTFDDVDFGTYQVRLALPSFLQQITRSPREVAITRSQDITGVNFGVKLVGVRGTGRNASATADPLLADATQLTASPGGKL
ncbi:MAG: peroxidase family protein [Pirellulales bacterium]